MKEYIKFEGITKLFPGQKALDQVSFTVKQGEVHAILGENGAGKSTLLNIFHGLFPATEGKVYIGEEEVFFANTTQAIQYGISKVHQEINIIPELTVAQNLMLGSERTKFGLLDKNKMNDTTNKVLAKLGCDFNANDKMKDLSTGKKQMVQIAKALISNAKIISFDEPTSSLSDGEVRQFFKIVQQLREEGITIIYITHKMDEVFRLCDRATVLRDGKYVDTFILKEITEEKLVHSMVGRDVSLFAQRLSDCCADENQVVLEVNNLSGDAGFSDINFKLHKGEILGFFGLVGAMRTEVMRGVFGADTTSCGTVYKDGKEYNKRSPNASVKAGIGLISENRKEEGFVGTCNNAVNICLASLEKYQNHILLSPSKMKKHSKKIGKSVGLIPNRPEFMTMSLSGGNAQKVILAKWLSTDVDVLIFDEPTKGIDIGAKAEIYKLMEKLVASGKSIILVSSELTEAIGMSDRVMVMREGKIVGEVKRENFSEEAMITMAMGGAKNDEIYTQI